MNEPVKAEIDYFKRRAEGAQRLEYGKFIPFKVMFKMGAPTCVTIPWLSFDGLIAYLLLLDVLKEDYFITPKKLDLTPYLPKDMLTLPLKRSGKVYHTSVSQFEPSTLRVDTIYKRFEERWTENTKQKKIRIGSGHYRAYMMKQPYICAKTVMFYACGCIDTIEKLIRSHIYALGNDTRIGYGAVRDILFEPTEEDWSLVKGGVAMRPIPAEMCSEYEEAAYLAYKPPYWSPRSVALCVPPEARCKLK